MTTSAGAAITYSEANNTLNSRLVYNDYFMESISHVVRERIPERVLHSKGTGAFGHFTVTHNISAICRAKLFSEDGKKTPIAVRFSLSTSEKDGSDTFRDTRGFAVKFYTEEGNFDLLSVSFPVFAVKDPILFQSFCRSQSRNPTTNLRDPNMFWDFVTLNPSTFLFFLYIFGDTGVINSYRHMPGYAVHTFQVENDKGETYFIKFHITPDSGIKTFTSEQARTIEEVDFDYNRRDLYNAIEAENFPVWTLSIQVLTLEDVNKIGSKAFDVTRILPIDEYPLMPIGKIELNRNPQNSFAQIEQMAMNPGNLVDGILGGPDTFFQARLIFYRDAQLYRLGANYNNIRVNCPFQTRPLVYNRDGRPPLGDNENDIPNYYPNSFNGPVPYSANKRQSLIKIKEENPYNFDQASDLYVSLSNEERNRLIETMLSSLRPAVSFIQQKAIKIFKTIHPDLGRRVEQGLLANRTNDDFV
ncbi:jg26427 [Pararge aegeria aegeria]|uniref:Jg26427 protein n=2 Tax=Pararge aegeria TaxID=116150 RepID=A0A8S4SHY9_9NEOP|nr:jg26427 [Pararge aegeria aegeria]